MAVIFTTLPQKLRTTCRPNCKWNSVKSATVLHFLRNSSYSYSPASYFFIFAEPFCQSNAARSLYDDNVLSRIRQAFVKTHQALRAQQPLESIWVNTTNEVVWFSLYLITVCVRVNSTGNGLVCWDRSSPDKGTGDLRSVLLILLSFLVQYPVTCSLITSYLSPSHNLTEFHCISLWHLVISSENPRKWPKEMLVLRMCIW